MDRKEIVVITKDSDTNVPERLKERGSNECWVELVMIHRGSTFSRPRISFRRPRNYESCSNNRRRGLGSCWLQIRVRFHSWSDCDRRGVVDRWDCCYCCIRANDIGGSCDRAGPSTVITSCWDVTKHEVVITNKPRCSRLIVCRDRSLIMMTSGKSMTA